MWLKPKQGWIKINFDGASRGNLGKSRVGCVARDEEGEVLSKGVQRLQDGTKNEAEAEFSLLVVELSGEWSGGFVVQRGMSWTGVTRWWGGDDADVLWEGVRGWHCWFLECNGSQLHSKNIQTLVPILGSRFRAKAKKHVPVQGYFSD
ncbi:uncharacterized protein LOC131071394 [Cryptomeria japonica]|uniref:uncharacterized protein LOC131071394 n=1 Tax=Cryptomeria japonica TaxID=3369 RepID=UPI0027DA7C04|nr:uncharacterized protein LOC131071394 [Cryptomeria japonica]